MPGDPPGTRGALIAGEVRGIKHPNRDIFNTETMALRARYYME